ncbi:hypothetical protein [Caldimonas sp. KR1-144]|uniref:hypothetical protein n=1 Tax=Caldimonas sp. KR1-144 TaxID=3400911 RepID=UPI003C00F5A9
MQLTCPCCHVRFPLEAALQDEAGRELLALLAGLDSAIARPLASYLGFFRATKTQLGWDRALRLAREVLDLTVDQGHLQVALDETVAAMAEKRAQSGWKPLGGHNYLRRVLESATARLEASAGADLHQSRSSAAPAPRSKTGQALVALEGMKRGR